MALYRHIDFESELPEAELWFTVLKKAIMDAAGGRVADLYPWYSSELRSAVRFWNENWFHVTDALGLDRDYVKTVIDNTIRGDWWEETEWFDPELVKTKTQRATEK